MTAAKIKEVKKLIRNGMPDGEVIADLKEEGFSDEEIQKIFYLSATENNKSASSEKSLWYLVSIAFMILGVTLLLGPPIWVKNYGYFFLIAGLVGLFVKYFILKKKM
jgi:hypothetical protein